jgi:hypothetical protein
VFASGSSLDNGGERLKLEDAANSTIVEFIYDDREPWPVTPDGEGPGMVLMLPRAGDAWPSDGAHWRASLANGGNPGGTDAFAYAAWKITSAPGEADTADSDSDGLTTFWEYAGGGTPGVNDSGKLPAAGIESVTVGELTDSYQTLTAIIRTGTDDLQLFPEAGSDLTAWSSGDTVLLRRVSNGGGTGTLTWRHVRPFRTDQRVFLRLRGVIQ